MVRTRQVRIELPYEGRKHNPLAEDQHAEMLQLASLQPLLYVGEVYQAADGQKANDCSQVRNLM